MYIMDILKWCIIKFVLGFRFCILYCFMICLNFKILKENKYIIYMFKYVWI